MRQGSNPRRLRGRGNGRKHPNPRSQNFESNGPEVKVRGNAQQVVEKYLALARDASSSGDRITAESYFQHAEHYYRIMTANGEGFEERNTHSHPGQPDHAGEYQGQTRQNSDEPALVETMDGVNETNGKDDDAADPETSAQDPGAAPQPDTEDNNSTSA